MFKYILPIILVGVTVAGFFTLTSPYYEDALLKKEQVASYNEALSNSKALESERDKLTLKYNSFDTEDLSKLHKLLPDNVDNIRLILEIEKIASPYGMILKDVKYDAVNKEDNAVAAEGTVKNTKVASSKDYGVWNLEFSTQGTYNNFVNLVKNLENNLRVVDISSIQFSSNADSGLSPSLSEVYKYSFKIKTYWLKN
jgi:hypothetical protein